MYERNKASGTVWVTLKRSKSASHIIFPPKITSLPNPLPEDLNFPLNPKP